CRCSRSHYFAGHRQRMVERLLSLVTDSTNLPLQCEELAMLRQTFTFRLRRERNAKFPVTSVMVHNTKIRMKKPCVRIQFFIFGFAFLVLHFAFLPPLVANGQTPKTDKAETPAPTVADFAYGNDSERQRLDFWQAKSDKPTPLVLLIHGGGWVAGDKSD